MVCDVTMQEFSLGVNMFVVKTGKIIDRWVASTQYSRALSLSLSLSLSFSLYVCVASVAKLRLNGRVLIVLDH